MFQLPSQTIFYTIEKSIKEYRRLAQNSIHQIYPEMTLDQTLLLFSLKENPLLSLTEHAKRIFKENSSITRMIDALIQKGYLTQAINLKDKRKFELSVTALGETTLKALKPTIESYRNQALEAIPDSELNQLQATLQKIIQNCQIMLLLLVMFCGTTVGYAQDLLEKNEKDELITNTSQIITENYVFPDIATDIVQYLSDKQAKGEYDDIEDPKLLAQQLTEDIQAISHDKHLRILYEPERIKKQQIAISVEDSLQHIKDRQNWLRSINYGFQEVSILEGNVGYLDLRRFSVPELAGATANAAMTLLKNADAIIIDIRQNGGGTPQMVQWIISYFYDGEPFLLSSFYKREGDFTKQFWTIPHPTSMRLPDIPLYVLTSKNTFSAAEEFAYDLKHLGRATIIGENTAGGAHPGGRIMASSRFNVWTPVARAINPITNSNWEGTGVIPDIEVTAEEAYDRAHIAALEDLSKQMDTTEYDELIESIRNK